MYKKKVSKQIIILFFEQLSHLINTNISLVIALKLIKKNFSKNKISNLINHIILEITDGKSLHQSLNKYPKYFPEIITKQIKFAEKSGKLKKCLNQITKDLKASDKMRRNILKAITYPAIMLGLAIILCAIFIIFIIPTFQNLFKEFNTELPYLTNIIIKISNNISNYIKIYILLFLIIFICIKKICYKNKIAMNLLQIIILKTPVIGVINKNYKCAKISSLLALSLESNIPIDTALIFISDIFKNHIISKNLIFCNQKLKAGKTLSQAIITSPRYKICFCEYLIQMIKLGEDTGSLINTLYKASEYIQKDIESYSFQINQLLEPIFIIISGIIVGVVIIAMYLPIFNLGLII